MKTNAASKIVDRTKPFPRGLYRAIDVAPQVRISKERLLELAELGFMPHYIVDKQEPLFRFDEVEEWMAQNALVRGDGRPLQDAVRMVRVATKKPKDIPSNIANVPGVQELPLRDLLPGIYFLCKGDEVVYVGQSICVSDRVTAHVRDPQKDFDRVFYITVPRNELNCVEATFIKYLNPAQQGQVHFNEGNKRYARPLTPFTQRTVEEVLRSLGVTGKLTPAPEVTHIGSARRRMPIR